MALKDKGYPTVEEYFENIPEFFKLLNDYTVGARARVYMEVHFKDETDDWTYVKDYDDFISTLRDKYHVTYPNIGQLQLFNKSQYGDVFMTWKLAMYNGAEVGTDVEYVILTIAPAV